MPSSLAINGWEIPIAEGSVAKGLEIIGEQGRSFGGSLITTERAEKRTWRLSTILKADADAAAIEALLRGRGDIWQFDSSLWSSKGQLAAFTRASTRYLLNGTLVNSGVAGYESGPHSANFAADKAIWAEEGTTPLLTANQASVEADLTGISGANSTRTRVTDYYWHGSACLRVVTNNAGADEGMFTTSVDVSPSLPYVASAWVRGDGGGTVKIRMNERDAADALIGTTNGTPVTLTSEWQRISVLRTFGATGVKARLYIDTNVQQGITFYYDGGQIEQKSYASSFHLPDAARVNESLAIPLAEISPAEGTIGVWVYINAITRRQVAGQYPVVFWLTRQGTSAAGIQLYHSATSANWNLATYNDAGAITSVAVADSYTPDGWHLFVATWALAAAKLFIDNVLRATLGAPNLPSAFGTPASVGSTGGTTNFLNTIFGAVILLPYRLTDAEVSAYYNSSRPYSNLPRLEVSGDLVGRAASNPIVCEAKVEDMRYRQLAAGLYREIEFTLMEV